MNPIVIGMICMAAFFVASMVVIHLLNQRDKVRVCYGVKIPKWCIGDAVNINKHDISLEQQKKVRDWYLKNLSNKCEVITNFESNWIGKVFGTQYYTPSSKHWNGFRLCVGENIYVRLY